MKIHPNKNKKKIRPLSLFGVLCLMVVGCSTSMKNLGAWLNYRSALMDSQAGFDAEADTDFQRVFERNSSLPAVRASYGMMLIRRGDKRQGLALIQEEREMFPESKKYLQPLLEKYGQ